MRINTEISLSPPPSGSQHPASAGPQQAHAERLCAGETGFLWALQALGHPA